MMIPPSISLIVTGWLGDISIAKLFIAGVFPGILTSIVYCVVIYFMVAKDPSLAPESSSEYTWRDRERLARTNVPLFAIALLVFGGIYLGLFTPTEAAGVGFFSVFIVGVATRSLKLKGITDSFAASGRTIAMMVFLFTGASVLASFVAITGITDTVTKFIVNLGLNRYLLITAISFLYLVLGCFIDAVGMQVLTIPIILPVVVSAGFNPIWYGIFLNQMIEIGLLTPPVGLNVYILEGVLGDKDLHSEMIFKGVLPFVIADCFVVVLMVVFPQICLWLPNTMG